MVYSIKFDPEKDQARIICNQATNSKANDANEIQNTKDAPSSKPIRTRCCAIISSFFIGGIIALAIIGVRFNWGKIFSDDMLPDAYSSSNKTALVHTEKGTTCFTSGFQDLSTAQECTAAVNYAKSFNEHARYAASESSSVYPKGCYIYDDGDMHFNRHSFGSNDRNISRSICNKECNHDINCGSVKACFNGKCEGWTKVPGKYCTNMDGASPVSNLAACKTLCLAKYATCIGISYRSNDKTCRVCDDDNLDSYYAYDFYRRAEKKG